jgi:O-antigen biosynthesis protein WbqV
MAALVPTLDRALLERLLGRPIADVLTEADLPAFRGRRALVTGAGGSVGSELARQLAASGVSRLALMDHSEYALFRVESELRQAHPDVALVTALGDVTRRADVRAAFDAAQPDVVYHAAAYKHVTFAERAPVQTLRVNALGALEVARAARAANARFMLISSDKAAQPSSVMGARPTEPAEIARAVLFIVDSPAMTGQMIALDGGQHLGWGQVAGRVHDE